MPKTDKPASKPTTAPSKSTSVGKKSGFSKNKERSYLARNSYKPVTKETAKSTAYRCPVTGLKFVFKSAYDLHRKALDNQSNTHCSVHDQRVPTYADIAEVTGTRYADINRRKRQWNPEFDVRMYLTVLVDEETGKTEKRWLTVKKYRNYQALLEDDGQTVIDLTADNDVQYVDPSEVNREGDDLSIVD